MRQSQRATGFKGAIIMSIAQVCCLVSVEIMGNYFYSTTDCSWKFITNLFALCSDSAPRRNRLMS